MKKFIDAFEGLKLDSRLTPIAEEIFINKIERSKNVLKLYIECHSLIQKEDIDKLIIQLKSSVFENFRLVRIVVYETYQLDTNFKIEEIFEAYLPSIKYELKKNSNFLYMFFSDSNITFENKILILKIRDNLIYKNKVSELENYLINVFRFRFGFDINIKTEIDSAKTSLARDNQEYISHIENLTDFTNKEESQEPNKDKDSTNNKIDKSEEDGLDNKKESDTDKTNKAENLLKKITTKSKRSPSKNILSSGKKKGTYANHTEDIITKICDIISPGNVCTIGRIIDFEETSYTRDDVKRYILTYTITDYTDSIKFKIFTDEARYEQLKKDISFGKDYKVKGYANYDNFERGNLVIERVNSITEDSLEIEKREDLSKEKRIELHAHTQMSAMDAIESASELISKADEFGMDAIAITDHGVVHSFPDAMMCAKGINKKREKDGKTPFKVIYGVEGYLVDDEQVITRRTIDYDLSETFVVFDIETTGTNKMKDKIIEIGAVKIRNGMITEEFSELIDPKMPLSPYIINLTKINDYMLKGKRTIDEVLKDFKKFVSDLPIVAHNADFDMGFIRQKGRELGIDFNNMSVDTVNMARGLVSDLTRYKLNTLANYFKIDLKSHHRALDDAICCAHIFNRLIKLTKKQDITNALNLNEVGMLDNLAISKLHKYHIILLVKNTQGMQDLYEIVSESHLKYLSGSGKKATPLIPKSLLNKFRENIIVGSACSAGELYNALLVGTSDEELASIVDFYDYLEIQPCSNNEYMINDIKDNNIKSVEDLQQINKRIINLGKIYNRIVVATGDVHFLNPEDAIYRAIAQKSNGYRDYDNQPKLFLHTTDEMLEEFEYLGKDKAREVVIENPKKISNQIEFVSPVSDIKATPSIPDSDKILRDICYEKARKMYGNNLPDIVKDRLDIEVNSIINNGYSVLYIIAQKLILKAENDGFYVGSRGSVGSSFAATCAGITEVNPLPAHYYCDCGYCEFDSKEIKECIDKGMCGLDLPEKKCPKCGKDLHRDGFDIPFQTFLGFDGDKEPDIDLNFSGDYQSIAHKQTEILFGKGQTFRAGTISAIQDKTALKCVREYFEEKQIEKRECEIKRIGKHLEGIRVTTGQHPGGIIVLPKGYEITQFCPVQHPANDANINIITTHFDYHKIEHNLLKLDILGHDNPTILMMFQELTGVDFRNINLNEPEILSLFESPKALGITKDNLTNCRLGVLGIPEMGTDVTMMKIEESKPKTVSDLLRISGLSHGTKVWDDNAQVLIRNGTASLEEVISLRDGIMLELIRYGLDNKKAFEIMEIVRRGNVAKGKATNWDELKQIMKDHNVPDWYIWSCERIEYMFPKAHAVAYVVEALRFAYYKIHYPKEFYAAYYSIRAKKFDYDVMCHGSEQVKFNINKIRDNEKNHKVTTLEKQQLGTLRIIEEMYARGIEFTPIDIYKAHESRFTIVDGKIMPSLTSIEGVGLAQAISLKEEANKSRFISLEDATRRTSVSRTALEYMYKEGMFGEMSLNDQISLF